MERLKETAIPNLIDADGSTLGDFENSKRGEISEHIKTNRKERDDKLKKASSIKTRIKDLVLRSNEGRTLKSEVGRIEAKLVEDVSWKHHQLKDDLEKKTRSILQDTIKDPMQEITNFYYKKRNAHSSAHENGAIVDELSLKIEQEKLEQNFKQENVKAVFSSKELRKDMMSTFGDFFDGRQNTAIYEGIQAPSTYSYEESKGFPIEVAKSTLEGLRESIKEGGVESVEDSPKLFKMLNDIAHIYPDGFKGEQGRIFVDLFVKRGLGLPMSMLAGMTNLIDLVSGNEYTVQFEQAFESKLNAICADKKWDQLGCACLSYSEIISEPAKKKLDTELHAYGLTFADIERAWDMYPASGTSSFQNVPENLNKMQKIEEERPGIVKALYSDFGIKEFRRYPVEVLIKQFDDKDKDEPYGVVLFTNADHNQSFDLRSEVIKSLFNQTSEHGIGMRVTEFDSRYEIMKRFAMLNDKYGEKNKMSYLFLGAHGEEDSFGVSYTQGVNKKDIDGGGTKRLKDFFIKNPEIIMASCSTGAENGIGQKISENFEATVHAPNKPTNVKAIDVNFGEDNKPHFKITYADDVLRTYDMGKKK